MLLPLLGGVLVSGGCDRREPSPTAPDATVAAGDPRQSIRLPGYVPMATASIPLASLSGPGTDVGWTALGTVRAGEYVRVRVSGEITLRLNQAFVDEYCQGNPLSNAAQCGRPPETVGAEGVSGGMLVVGARIRYPDGDWVYVPLSPSPLFPGQRVGAWQARAEGVVEFMRTGHHWVHGGIPVFAFGGSQSISLDITRLKPKLKLTCTGPDKVPFSSNISVKRANEIECEVTAEPAGPVTETSWVFSGAGSQVPGPAGNVSWGGVMVVGGMITVAGNASGQEADPATISVAVTDREWRIDYPAEPPVEFTRDSLRYPPISIQTPDLGDGILGKYREVRPSMGYQEGSGPNEGWWFIAPLPTFAREPALWLNAALDPRDPFYRAQQGGRGISLTRPLCGQDFMRQAARYVLRHEKEHHRIAETFFEGRGSILSDQARVYDPDMSADIGAELVAPIIAELDSLQAAHDRSDKLRITCDFTPVTR